MVAINFRVEHESLLPVRPDNLDAVHLRFFSETKMGRVRMLRSERVARHELANLFSHRCGQDYPGADR